MKIANDKHTATTGLKDKRYNEMYFPRRGRSVMNMNMTGMTDPVYYQGLSDDGKVIDEGIAYPGQNFNVMGNVYERRIKAQQGVRLSPQPTTLELYPLVQQGILTNEEAAQIATGLASPELMSKISSYQPSQLGVEGFNFSNPWQGLQNANFQPQAATITPYPGIHHSGNTTGPYDGRTGQLRSAGANQAQPAVATQSNKSSRRGQGNNSGSASTQANNNSGIVPPVDTWNEPAPGYTTHLGDPGPLAGDLPNAGQVIAETPSNWVEPTPQLYHQPGKQIIGWESVGADGAVTNRQMNPNFIQQAGQAIGNLFQGNPATAENRNRVQQARAAKRNARKDFRDEKANRRLVRRAANLEQQEANLENRNNVSQEFLNNKFGRLMYKDATRNARNNRKMEARFDRKAARQEGKINRTINNQNRIDGVTDNRLDRRAQRVAQNQHIQNLKNADRNRLLTELDQKKHAYETQQAADKYNAKLAEGVKGYGHNMLQSAIDQYAHGGRIVAQDGVLYNKPNTADPTYMGGLQEYLGDTYLGPTEQVSPEDEYNYLNNSSELKPIYADPSNPTLPSSKATTVSNTPTGTNASRRRGLFGNLSDDAKIQLTGEFLPAIYNLAESFKAPEWQSAKFNPEMAQHVNRLEQRRANIDRSGFRGRATAADRQLANQAGSTASANANRIALYNRLGEQERLASREEDKMNKQYAMDASNARVAMANDRRQALQQQEAFNNAAKLTRDQLRNKAVTQFGTGIVDVGRQVGNANQNELEWNLMGQMYSKYAPVEYQKYLNGEISIDELIQFTGISPQNVVSSWQPSKPGSRRKTVTTNVGAGTPGISATQTTTY